VTVGLTPVGLAMANECDRRSLHVSPEPILSPNPSFVPGD
jgi:hypothetical protein